LCAGNSRPVGRELLKEIRRYACGYRVTPAMQLLLDEIRGLHGPGVRAIVYYGSCLQTGCETDGLLDLYVLVDDYAGVFKNPLLSFLNWILPPNVFYLEVPLENKQVIRAKYAVVSLSDFVERTSGKAFHSYFWARFCQPVAMVYVSDPRVKRAVEIALARAVITFFSRTVPCMGPEFTARQLWLYGLGLSYGAELRPEKKERLLRLWKTNGHVLERLTPAAVSCLPYKIRAAGPPDHPVFRSSIPESSRRICRFSWFLRTVQGKILSVLRLIKAAFTFRGGVDYALWKIQRHTGVEIEVSPYLRRHPLVAMVVLSWKLFSKRAIK